MADLPADSTSAVRARLPAAPIGTACGLVAATVYVAAVDPSDRGVFPPCAFRSVTGWWCPGCGLTRAMHQLMHGDVLAALKYNALTPLVLTLIAVLWIDWYARAVGKQPMPRPSAGWAAAGGVAAVAFAVLRNLPGVDGLRG
jgi:Protein of unknown function (DUF2752)